MFVSSKYNAITHHPPPQFHLFYSGSQPLNPPAHGQGTLTENTSRPHPRQPREPRLVTVKPNRLAQSSTKNSPSYSLHHLHFPLVSLRSRSLSPRFALSPPNQGNSTHRPNNLTSINPTNIPLQSLPPRHPAPRRICDRHQTFENLACASLDAVGVVYQIEKIFAIGAAEGEEFLRMK